MRIFKHCGVQTFSHSNETKFPTLKSIYRLITHLLTSKKNFKVHQLLDLKSVQKSKESLFQHCERSELRLHCSRKINTRCQRWSILAIFFKIAKCDILGNFQTLCTHVVLFFKATFFLLNFFSHQTCKEDREGARENYYFISINC